MSQMVRHTVRPCSWLVPTVVRGGLLVKLLVSAVKQRLVLV
jgi:hypothetical protein